jgi:hypothetical protein
MSIEKCFFQPLQVNFPDSSSVSLISGRIRFAAGGLVHGRKKS